MRRPFFLAGTRSASEGLNDTLKLGRNGGGTTRGARISRRPISLWERQVRAIPDRAIYFPRVLRGAFEDTIVAVAASFANRSARSLAMFFLTAMSFASYSARAITPSSAAFR